MEKRQVSLIILYDNEGRCLLQHRTDDAKLLPGHWAFFGGGIKQGETPEEALKRESVEEINFEPQSPKLFVEEDFKVDDTEGHLFVYIESYDGDKSKLILNEGQGWGWFSGDELSGLKMIPRDRDLINRICEHVKKAKGNGRGKNMEKIS